MEDVLAGAHGPHGSPHRRPRHIPWHVISSTRLAAGMSERDVAGFLAAFASAAEPVEVHFMWRPQLANAADELILEAAVNGQAEAIVTHNVRDFQPATRVFGIPVKSPAQVLKELSK